MTTEEIVRKLLEYIKAGQNLKAEEELYAADALSVEQNGHSVRGLEGIMAKTKGAMEGIAEFHGGGVATTYVGPDAFLLEFDMDVTPKGGERMRMHEFGFYKVADGKISEEYFFMQPMQ